MKRLISRILTALVNIWNRYEAKSHPLLTYRPVEPEKPAYAPWLTPADISKLEDQRKRFEKPMGRFFVARLDADRFALFDTRWSPSPAAILHVGDMNQKQADLARAMSAQMWLDDPQIKKLPWDWQIQYSPQNGLEEL